MVKITQEFPKLEDGGYDIGGCVAVLCERDPSLATERLVSVCERIQKCDPQTLGNGLEFAHLLIDLQLDSDAILAGLAYRAFRNRQLDAKELRRTIGSDAAGLTEEVERMASVSLLKLSNTPLLSTESRDQVDNVRHMLVALIDDVRVAIVKLAERIIALRRAKGVPAERQRRLAREVLEVFSPLANRLGIWRLKWELEDLAFRYLQPDAYKDIAGRFDGRRVERETQIDAIERLLTENLQNEGIRAQVEGRAKHIYSIWRKMNSKGVGFAEIYDVRAVRVLVDNTRDCYASLGVIHTSWRHIPSEFDDYIANPKDNGYRSIHTAVLGPDGQTLEVQIRTHEMHRESELGVCAHWSYKDEVNGFAGEGSYGEKLDWLRQVLEWHEEVGGFASVGDELRSNIEHDRIYVYTPEGHVIDLTRDATPLDFAYRVHTEIGNHCAGARINGEPVPLTTSLLTGQRVEIITAEGQQPSRDWLDPNLGYVKTARAKAKIQGWFRAQDASQNIAAGRRVLERELNRLAVTTDLEAVAASLGYESLEGLFYGVGIGDSEIPDVFGSIDALPQGQLDLLAPYALVLDDDPGSSASPVALAICCRPGGGCEIVTQDEGDVRLVHRVGCAECVSGTPAGWGGSPSLQTYRVEVRGFDRPGLLHDITAVLLADRASMSAMQASSDADDKTARIAFDLGAGGLKGLVRIIDRMSQVEGVIDARRVG